MKNIFFLILGVILVSWSIFTFFTKPINQIYDKREVKIGGTTISVDIADTLETRAQGLSGRKVLADEEGMFFIFENSGIHGFWMKGMNFGIDMIWINESFKVVGVERNVSPETFPKVFYPKEPIKYVLEVPSGFSEKNGIDMGSQVSLE